MKLNITKKEYDALSEELQGLYKEVKDGEGYTLEVEGMEDIGALKRVNAHEKEQRKAAKEANEQLRAQLEELQSQLNEFKDESSRKKGDVDALEKSYQEKLDKLSKKYEDENKRLTNILKEKTVDNEAVRLATELSGDNAKLILPHIRSRLGFELTEEGAHVRVLDADGKPTADSIEDLKNSYFTDEIFAPIVVGSKASGGGAAGAKGGGAVKKKKLSEMTATEEALFANQNPEEYKQMVAVERRA